MATTHTIGQTPARATVAWVRAVGILATLAWGALGARAGTLSWPVVNPNPMSNGYAAFNVLGNGKYHTGFDLTSGSGNGAVLAAGTGTVLAVPIGTYVNENHYMGHVVIIDHNQGRGPFSLYAHLASILVSTGQSVVAGQQIGVMGNTGCRIAPGSCSVHLHFELKPRPVLGNVDSDLGPVWGYTLGHPNLYGYINPYPYLDYSLPYSTPLAVRSTATQVVRTGPDPNQYTTAVTSVAANQEFAAFSQWGSWYQIFLPSLDGPASGWIQATPSGAALREVRYTAGGITGVNVRQSASASSQRLSYVWNKQWLVAWSPAAAGNGCTSAWQQTHLAANAVASSGYVCGDYLFGSGGGASAPAVTTGPASGVGASVATLNATVNPNGGATDAWFEYGTTTGYGLITPQQALGSGTSPLAVSANIAGLTCGTLYHFRARASNSAGVPTGGDATFTTSPCASGPTVVTGVATNVGPNSATLNATVNPNGSATSAWFEYGTTTGYGLATPQQGVGSGTSASPVSAVVTGLACGTSYHFRARASSAAGIPAALDAAFTTAACPSGGPRPFRDLDGDGRADLMWRRTTGELLAWYVDGMTLAGQTYFGPAGTTWRIEAIADFDGDGRADIFWRYQPSGHGYIWFMNGPTLVSHGWPSAYRDLAWRIEGLGDLNGDGRKDIVWRASDGRLATWLMQGLSVSADTDYGVMPTTWQLGAVGDLNGDGRADMLWRAPSSGANYVWFMQGTTLVGHGPTSLAYDSSWQIAGRGDLNGDGRVDLVWRRSDGRYAVWLMSGLDVLSQGDYGVMSAPWSLLEIDDFNGDGRADLLWRSATNGATYTWLMSGQTIIGHGALPASVDTSWSLQSALR
jgi:hypothetical protein